MILIIIIIMHNIIQPLNKIGKHFIKIMKCYFGNQLTITVSTLRKIFESYLASTKISDKEKKIISASMLHDPVTAERYYVLKDQEEESQKVNEVWRSFRDFYSSNNNNPTIEVQPSFVCNQSPIELIEKEINVECSITQSI